MHGMKCELIYFVYNGKTQPLHNGRILFANNILILFK